MNPAGLSGRNPLHTEGTCSRLPDMGELLGLLVLLLFALLVVVVMLSAIVAGRAVRPPRHTVGYAVAHGLAADPGELGLEFEAWTLERPDGATLAVWEVVGKRRSDEATKRRREERHPLATDGHQPLTAVFVHGWGQSRIDMLARIEPWDVLCDRLVLYDLRGHGETQGGASRLGHGEERDLLALLERLGEGPVVLVGHSMGAVIAIEAAARAAAPGGIIGVVAYAPYCDFHESLRRRMRSVDYPARPVTDLAILWLRLGGVRHRDVIRAVSALGTPLLVVARTEDRLHGLEDARRIVEAATSATLHEQPAERNSDPRVADEHDEAVRSFVTRLR